VAGAVVDENHYESVAEPACFFEGFDDSSYAGVHFDDLGGVDLHAALLPLLMGLIFPWEHARVTRRHWGVGIDDAEFFHAGESLAAQLVPAHFVATFLFIDFFSVGVEGPVSGGIGGVEQQGRIFWGFADVVGGCVTDGVGIVEFLVILPEVFGGFSVEG